MPRLRRLSGREVISVFETLGFRSIGGRGSHVKLRRIGSGGEKQTLTVPDHKIIDTGTTRAIMRQATRYISFDELKKHFYAD